MATIFTVFPHLPRELRDEIWQNAIQRVDERPGFHCFTTFTAAEEKELSPDHLVGDKDDEDTYKLALPPTTHAKDASPATEQRQSAYWLDGGLWTACKESRQVIERHYGAARRDPAPGQKGHSFVLGYFGNAPGTLMGAAVFPKKDLVCLAPHKLATADFRGGLAGLNFLSRDPVPSYAHPRHVALEVDDKVMDARCLMTLASRIEDMVKCQRYRFGKLWFIDRRRAWNPARAGGAPSPLAYYGDDQERAVFYGLKGCFVEVTSEDDTWDRADDAVEADTPEPPPEAPEDALGGEIEEGTAASRLQALSGDKRDMFTFTYELELELMRRFTSPESPYWDSAYYSIYCPDVGILAYHETP